MGRRQSGGGNDNKKYERLSAGYGPYALTRLCAETGGVFFVADQGSIRFDSDVMRDYQPDYRPVRDYIKDRDNCCDLDLLSKINPCIVSRPTASLS